MLYCVLRNKLFFFVNIDTTLVKIIGSINMPLATAERPIHQRYVVIGKGALAANGNTFAEIWNSVVNKDTSGITEIEGKAEYERFGIPSLIAGHVKNFEASDFIHPTERKGVGRCAHMQTQAYGMALQDAKLKIVETVVGDEGEKKRIKYKLEGIPPESWNIVSGTSAGDAQRITVPYQWIQDNGYRRFPVRSILEVLTERTATVPGMNFGTRGATFQVGDACLSGALAPIIALNTMIAESVMDESNATKMSLAGGNESTISPETIASFCVIHALTTKFNDRPHLASRPLAKDADGFVMAEGASGLLIARLDYALKIGAKPQAEIIGWAMTADAKHDTAPDQKGEGLERAIKKACSMARISPEEVEYVNFHATSTEVGDRPEVLASKRTYGKHTAYSSTKAFTGHNVGEAGNLEAAFCVQALQDGYGPPPCGNLERDNLIDEAQDIDVILDYDPARKIDIASSHSLAFGGGNSVLVFRRYIPPNL